MTPEEQKAFDDLKAENAKLKAVPVTGDLKFKIEGDGIVKAGQKIKITGTEFGKVQGTSLVIFGGEAVQADEWSDVAISVTAPATVKQGALTVAVGNRRGGVPYKTQ